jgi:hypothetical protein
MNSAAAQAGPTSPRMNAAFAAAIERSNNALSYQKAPPSLAAAMAHLTGAAAATKYQISPHK